jgi:DNA-binding NarL/FixJ family response regulator
MRKVRIWAAQVSIFVEVIIMKNTPNKNESAKVTILIVEDREGVRFYLRALVSDSFPECHCFEARDGEEAVAMASLHLPDIVLMDIGLPKMNGIEATRRIKDAVPKARVVIVTNHETPEYENAAAIAGASAYVLKNRVNSELIPIVTKLLSQTQKP